MIRTIVRTGAVALLLLTLGCHRDRVTNVVLDLPPHRVDGVYSVTGDREVTIRWRANQENDIDHYRIYRNLAPTGTFTLVGTTSQTEFVDFSVTNGQTYYYAVSAVDRAGQESAELSYENVFDTPRPEGFGATVTNTFSVDGTSGWDFSARARRSSLDALTDVYYGAANGHTIVYAATGTEIQDAGYVALRDVDFAPPAGWSGDGEVEAIPGHSYIVLTRDGHYAKFEVVSRDNSTMVFDWAYQIDVDNPELTRRAPR
ncbi:MAG: fibronectin type III domain-containing protein [Candidatus Latescibacteria bacterium]|nr:fibronectin type III domain-containing protein [Candidatus Latescibacterota bacterium]